MSGNSFMSPIKGTASFITKFSLLDYRATKHMFLAETKQKYKRIKIQK